MHNRIISIITPMYNEERYIGRFLDSLKKQTLKDFEIILIDDGSKDNTVKIAETYSKDFQLKILKQKHGGPGKARNWGAEEAKGNILIFVDADMYFDKNYVNNIIQPILNKDEVATTHGVEIVGNIENIWAKTSGINRLNDKIERSTVYRAVEKSFFFSSGGYNDDCFAFEDKIGEKNNILALSLKNAICYHNNPTSLKEVFYHDEWMGESIVAKRRIEYKLFICFLFLLLIITILLCIFSKISWISIILGYMSVYFVLLEIFAIFRIYKDKKVIKEMCLIKKGSNEINYIRSIPILYSVKLMGYIYGILKYLFKNYNR